MLVRYHQAEVKGEIELPEITDGSQLLKLFELAAWPQADVRIEPQTQAEAAALLRHFTDCTRARQTPSPVLSEWISRAFEEALSSKRFAATLCQQLGFSRKARGRPENRSRNESLYRRMTELVEAGASVLEAAHQCSDEFGIHEANVQKVYYLQKNLRDGWIEF